MSDQTREQPERSEERDRLLRRGLRLEAISISWDVIERIIAVAAAVVSGSITLMGFGIERVIEVTAAGTLYWRLRKESRGEAPPGRRRATRAADRRPRVLRPRAHVAYEAISGLGERQGPESSAVGMGMAAAALIAMPFLAVAKRRTGRDLGSEALVADSRETIASTYLPRCASSGAGRTSSAWLPPAGRTLVWYSHVRTGPG